MNNDTRNAHLPTDEPELHSDAQSWQELPVGRLHPFSLRGRGQRTKALFALVLVCFFWGTTWVASRQGVKYMPALQLAGIRQVLAGLCFVGFFVAKGVSWPKGRQWGPILVLSFLNFMLSNALSTWGVRYIPAGLGSVIGAIYPIWLVIIALALRTSKLSAKTALGMALGFTGICIIFYEHLHEFLDPDFRFGIAISFLSTWSWAFGTLYTKKQAAQFNPYFSLGLQFLISGVVLLTGMWLSGKSVPVSEIPWRSWAAIGYLVTFGSIIAFAAFLYALQHLPTAQVSLYAYINPVVAVLLGALLIDEPLSLFIGVGTLVTLYGVYLVNRSFSKEK
ncbi:DMT family transporter [Flaviaesturariibacter amylovorans]|uniref:Drug/metabolite exporter YedA n=1 Tax=Flaviaesturariibacter amylovorans TaxID=1084520 RepID=A0ABP8GAG1_9BACT